MSNYVEDIRRALADYMRAEGCSCCRKVEKQNEARARLAKLLHVPLYDDRSGYDFNQFSINPVKL